MNSALDNQPNDGVPAAEPVDLPPPDFQDPVIEAYKKDVDRSLLRENLKLTVAERSQKFERNMHMAYELRQAGRDLREQSKAQP